MTHASNLIANRTLTREDVQSIVGGRASPVIFEQCVFDGEDLSGLDLRACTFFSCSAAEASFARSQLEGTHWLSCKARNCVGFFLAEIGPSIYNKAIADVQDCLQVRVSEVQIEVKEEEFRYWHKA